MTVLARQPAALLRQLVDIPSVTGRERALGGLLLEGLSREGWQCRRQPVGKGRFNVAALGGRPDIVLSSHLDTVPPFIASSEDGEAVYGRGACDAKGQVAAMIAAARALVEAGHRDLALLFVVGEETDSAGARAAARDGSLACRYLINGEPTDNHLVSGHKGTLGLRLKTRGRAAHSGYPERGESAIEKLLDMLQRLRGVRWPSDGELGETHLNIGCIQAGGALNVVPDQAQADLLWRTVAPSARYLEQIRRAVGEASLEKLCDSEPQRLHVVEGFPVKSVRYGTDIPYLRALGTPLLFGPGSIFHAHTDGERLLKSELQAGIDGLVRLAGTLKGEPEALD